MIIDNTTGMPELPEGHWWEVTQERTDLEIMVYSDLRVSVMKTVEVKKTLFRKAHTKRDRVASGTQPWNEFVKADSQTRRLQTIAFKVWGDYQRGVYAESLLGEYPPKKLKV